MYHVSNYKKKKKIVVSIIMQHWLYVMNFKIDQLDHMKQI